MERIQLVKIFLAFLLFEHSKCFEDQSDSENASNISNNGTSIKDFPYFVSLQGCSAAILSDRWVLTAAHCVSDPKLKFNKHLWVGGESISNSKQITFDKIIKHPQFKYFYQIPINDIALIHLTEPLKFTDNIKPVKLHANIQSRHSELLLVGKGKHDSDMESSAIDSLELVRLTPRECLKYIPNEYHQYIIPHLSMFNRVNVCTKSLDDNAGICLDESGNLLVQNHQLIGLLSYGGGGNCRNNRIMFFTNVPTYVQWVKSVTGLK